ncbi:MAG: PAS domain-containing protein [Sedimentisphaerales bacterium]|nr:PAS domain-containing protein [Sedimentisphaerales bacterium]
MLDKKDQDDMSLFEEELNCLIEAVCEVPYSAPPSEQPQVICFSRRIEELTGYTADQILADQQLWMNMVYPADRDRVFAVFAQCKNRGMPFEIGYRLIHKDGSLRYVIDRGEAVFDDQGQMTQIDGTITDVSEYKKARIRVCQRNPEVTKRNDVGSTVFQKV